MNTVNLDKNNQLVLLQENMKLSECLLWGMERDYFEKKGIEAWLHDVPFYITSNPFIAKSYAKMVIYFIRDWVVKHPEARKHPFYVMELGTGPGQFSYYAVKALDELRQELGMHDIKIIYVMSDFAKANLDYHQSHPALIPYVKKGLLDFAIQDMSSKDPIILMNSQVELNQKTLVNPLTLFANYVFDTIANDSFTVSDGKLYELLVSLSTEKSNIENGKPVILDKIQIDHNIKEIKKSYYHNPELDAVLDLYKNNLKNSSFLIPIGSIRGLDHLRKLANGKIVLISSDKAYSELASMENLGYPSLTYHGGCFSMMANCHAIGQYFINGGGDFFAQSTRRGLKTCFYTTAFKLEDMPETRLAVKECIDKYSPTDFFNAYRQMSETVQTSELDAIASFLELSGWDPRVYTRINSRILSLINEADHETVAFLAANMHKLADNYYYMPNVECVLFEVGVFYHAIHQYQTALKYYRQAEAIITSQFGLKYNIALCLHHEGKNHEALINFKEALKLDPNSKEAQDWIAFLEKQIVDMKFTPKSIREVNVEA